MKKFLAICLSALPCRGAVPQCPCLQRALRNPGQRKFFLCQWYAHYHFGRSAAGRAGATVRPLPPANRCLYLLGGGRRYQICGHLPMQPCTAAATAQNRLCLCPAPAFTMTGGTVRDLIGGNLGANAKTPLATVTGDVVMRVAGDAKVSNYIAGGGYNNACVNGTVSITLTAWILPGWNPLCERRCMGPRQ